MVWVSALVIGLVMAGVSAGIQSQIDEKVIKTNAVFRDGLLGAIFTCIVWTLAPDTMISLTSSVQTLLSSTSSSVATSITTSTQAIGGGDVDVQVGPVKF